MLLCNFRFNSSYRARIFIKLYMNVLYCLNLLLVEVQLDSDHQLKSCHFSVTEPATYMHRRELFLL